MTWIKLILVLSLLSVLCYTTEKALQLESSLSFLVIPQWAAMRGPLSEHASLFASTGYF